MATFLLALVITVVIAAIIVAVIEFGIPRIIVILGEVDSWWSPFQTLPPPGEMYILVRGSKTGPFDRLIHSVIDQEFDDVTHEFRDSRGSTGTAPRNQRDRYLATLGVAWVGFFRFLFYREVRHDKWEKDPQTGKWGMVSKTRPGPSIYFRYNMAVEVKSAETVGNFPVDGVVVFTVQVANPVKAFFFAGGWEAQTTAAVAGRFRKYVSDLKINDLREEHKAGGLTLVDQIRALGGRQNGSVDPNGLYQLFGVEIIDARFVLFDLVSGDEEMSRAVKALEIETLNAEAAAKRGEGERAERQARAEGIRAEVEAWGSNPVGATVATAEAIKVAKPQAIGAGVITNLGDRRERGA